MFTNVFLANQPMSQLWLIYRLSLDPIDGSPFGHIMKFTQSSFPFYLLGLNTVSKLVWFFLGGGGLMLYVLKLFRLFQQILSGLVVSVAYWTIWVVGSNPTVFRINFFSFRLKRLEISSKCDIKAENSSTLCTFHEGERGCGRWDLMLTWYICLTDDTLGLHFQGFQAVTVTLSCNWSFPYQKSLISGRANHVYP